MIFFKMCKLKKMNPAFSNLRNECDRREWLVDGGKRRQKRVEDGEQRERRQEDGRRDEHETDHEEMTQHNG